MVNDCCTSNNVGSELRIRSVAADNIDPGRDISLSTTIHRCHLLAGGDEVLFQSDANGTRTENDVSQCALLM